MNLMSVFPTVAISVALLVSTDPLLAQEPGQETSSDWDNSMVLYLLAPTIDGTVGVGPVDPDIEIDPSTVLDTLDGGFLGAWVVENGQWGFFLDIVYMDLSADFKLAGERIPGELGNKQLIVGLNGLYSLTDKLQLMAGALYTDVSMKLSLDGPVQPRRLNSGDSWADPTIGLRFATPISERWSFGGFGQIGGGVNADLVWQLTGSFSFQMSPRSSLVLGYRYMDFDYESGKGSDRFKFDVVQHGPALGFRFDF